MSLLQFAKDNKQYLNLFSALTDNDARVRSQTVRSIIKQLNDEKATHDDTSIELLQSVPLIKYTLQRLIRGLTSSKHSNRIAFANAFSQVLTHCKWLSTAFILSTVHKFCDHEKAKQSTIIESLLLIRNLLILILFQTHRLYELSWNDLQQIISDIASSKQAKNLIDLSCQSMICLLNIMEQDNDDATKSETDFKSLLIGNRVDLLKTFAKLIPCPINSFKLISITQMKLILRMYSNHYQFATKWTVNDIIDNKTIQILPAKISLVYEFLLQPMKKPDTKNAMSLASIMNIYNDKTMWKALISLQCNSDDKEERNKGFGKCCDKIFYFIKQNMLRQKYVSLVSLLCEIFIRCGVALSVSNDTLFTHVLHPAILSFVSKYASKYQQNETEHKAYKQAFDFMMELKLLSNHAKYGLRIKSILMSSSVNFGETEKNTAKESVNSNMKTLVFYEKVFWRANGFIHANKSTQFRNKLSSNERDCATSVKSIANILQQYVQNKDKKRSLRHALWLKKGIRFMIRVVFFKSKEDIWNKSRFENIWFTAKKALRILFQSVFFARYNVKNYTENTLNNEVFIGYCNEAIESFKENDALSYRSKNIMAMDTIRMSLKSITEMTDKINEMKLDYLSKAQRQLLCDLVRFIAVYYYMDDTSTCVKILKHLQNNILDTTDELKSVQFGAIIMDIVVKCIQSDDMFLSSLSRHMFLGFGDLYNSETFDKLLQFISTDEEMKEEEEFAYDDDEKDEDEDVFMEDSDDSDDDESSDDEDDDDEDEDEEDEDDDKEDEDSDSSSSEDEDYDITDYGAFAEGDVDLEKDDVNAQELERMDQALVAVFREKQKLTETRVNAKKSRIQKRVFHHLKAFAEQYGTSPLLLIMFTPLMMSLWKLFEEVTSEFQKAKNKRIRRENDDQFRSKKERKVAPKMRTIHGVPLWRFDSKLKKSWGDYTEMLHANSKKQNKFGADVVSTKKKHFQHIVVVINAILAHSANSLFEADTKNEIKIEWIKDIIYDIIEITSESPTYEHEMMGVKVLCYLCKIYQLKCNENIDRKQIWNHIKLNEDDEEEDDNEVDINQDISWLFELWYIQLKLFMKQPSKTWYFAREFFDVLARRNPFIVWKLIHEALDAFDLCKNSWSETQIFVLIGDISTHGVDDKDDMKWILKDVAERMVVPLKDCLNKTMEATKKMMIARNAGKFVRALGRYKVGGENKKKILDVLGNSKLHWQQMKAKKKKMQHIKNKATNKKKVANKNKKSKNNKNQKSKQNQRKRKFKNNNKNNANPKKKRKLNSK